MKPPPPTLLEKLNYIDDNRGLAELWRMVARAIPHMHTNKDPTIPLHWAQALEEVAGKVERERPF